MNKKLQRNEKYKSIVLDILKGLKGPHLPDPMNFWIIK